MIITYFRSSSYNCHDMCRMQYFSEYVLGWRGPANIKADKGTIVHKVLEVLANAKVAVQKKEITVVEEDLGCEWEVNRDTILDEEQVDDIIEKVYDWYTSHKTQHDWKKKDFHDCHAWVLKALELNNGEFDPRKKDIVQAEAQFDFEIHEPWAFYQYDVEGERVEGFLALKGTIDQVTRINKHTYEILDWKTGRRLNWATGAEKDMKALQKDPQLRMYHYAASKLWPEISDVMVTIYFINDGGPFTVFFDKDTLAETEEMIKKKFEIIKADQHPAKSVSWKCSKFCHQGRSTFEGTHITPLIAKRDGHITKKGGVMTKCEQIDYSLNHRSMDSVVKHMSAPGHTVTHYHAPGSVDEDKDKK